LPVRHLPQAKKILLVAQGAPKHPLESSFAPGDIVRVPGVDALVLSRILGAERAKEYTITSAAAAATASGTSREKGAAAAGAGGGIANVPYYWGVDPAVYHIYNSLDPLYFWKIAGLVSRASS
jgi:hypothetical protein